MSKCSLCYKGGKGDINYKCEMNHRIIHEKCVLEYRKKLKSINCHICKEYVQNYSKNIKTKCIECTIEDVFKVNSDCKKQKSLCVKCLKKTSNEIHFKDCYFCRPLIEIKPKNCEMCKRLPGKPIEGCPIHLYCEVCLSLLKRERRSDCQLCREYTESFRKPDQKKCAKCKIFSFPTIDLCRAHCYCENCINKYKGLKFIDLIEIGCINCVRLYEEKFKNPNAELEKHHSTSKLEKKKSLKEDSKLSKEDSFKNSQTIISKGPQLRNSSAKISWLEKMTNPNEVKKCAQCYQTNKPICQGSKHCLSCTAKYIGFSHVLNCEYCSENLKRCNRCMNYFEKEKIFPTPTCQEHKHCEDCLSRKPKKNSYECCPNCIKYYSVIDVVLTKDQVQCNLCPGFPIGKIKCPDHGYCKGCTDFLLNNDFSKLPKIKNCMICIRKIADLKEGEKTPDLAKNIYEEVKFEEIASYNLRSDETDKSLEYSKKLVPSNGYGQRGMVQESYAYSIPNTKYIQHILKNNNIDFLQHAESQSFNPNIILKSKSESESVPNTNNSYIQSSNSSNFLNPKTEYPISKTQYINSNSMILNNSANKNLSYNNKSVIIHHSDSFGEDFLKSHCIKCKSDEDIYGFLCNHNYCKECLVLLGGKQIFIYNKNSIENPSAAKKKFSYYCEAEKCTKVMKIPTKMVLDKLKAMIENPQIVKNNNEFNQWVECFKYLFQIQIEEFLYFYDGVKIRK